MQAYQSSPCPYCGATWNPPGAQTCANCRNQLPPPGAAYPPPGYPPAQAPGQPQAPDQPQYSDPNQGYARPAGYPQPAQPDYSQAPPPDGYGQPAQPEAYQTYQPPAYGAPAPAPAQGQTITILGQTFTLPFALPFALPTLPAIPASGLSLPKVR